MKKFESVEDQNKAFSDNFSIQIKFKNESLASIHYFSNGSKKVAKERLEVYSDGTIFVLDNFKKLKSYGKINIKNNFLTSINQDKGQNKCMRSFIDSLLNGKKSPIELEDIFSLHRNLFRV